MRRRRPDTPSSVADRLKRGIGSGTGEDYRAWIHHRDVPSWGESGVRPYFARRRPHCYLSSLEEKVGLLLAWDLCVDDMREQYPLLPVDLTVELARRRGTGHPSDQRHPRVRTLDWLVDHRPLGTFGISIKPDGLGSKPGILDLIQIERDFCAAMTWRWAPVGADDIPATRAANLQVISECWRINDEETADEDAAWLESTMRKRKCRFIEACDLFDRQGRQPGAGLTLCWHQLAHKRWSIDLDAPLCIRTLRPAFIPPRPEPGWAAGLRLQ